MTKHPIFVLSTGRCGTLALQRFLKRSAHVEAFHRYRGRRSRYWNDMSFVLEQNFAFYRALQDEDHRARSWVMKRLRRSRGCLIERVNGDGKGFVELNHEFAPYAPLLVEAYPGAKFVHLIREPSAVVTSFMRKFNPPPMTLPAFMGTRYSVQGQYVLRYGYIRSLAQRAPASFRNYVEKRRFDTQLHPFAKVDGHWLEREEWSAFEKTCWYWNAVNELVSETLEQLPSARKLTMRFEEMFGSECATVTGSFLDFAGVSDLAGADSAPFFEQRINVKKVHEPFPSPKDWDVEMHQTLLRHCGRTMKTFSYGSEVGA